MTYISYRVVNFGSAKAGLATVGYALYDANHTIFQARTTTGVQDLSGGGYGVAISILDAFQGSILWDTGEGTPLYTSEDINPLASVSLTQYGESGPIAVDYRVLDTDNSTPLPGVAVYGSSDAAGLVRSRTRFTDDLGIARFYFYAGDVYFWKSHPDIRFSNPELVAVA